MSVFKRIVAGLVLIPAGLAAILLAVGGLAFFVQSDGGSIALLAAAAGVMGLPGVYRLYRVANAPGVPGPGWWAWLTSFALIGVPAYFIYGYVHYYGTERPLKHAKSVMMSELLSVADGQRSHFEASGTFAPDLAALDTLEGRRPWRPAPEVTLTITRADSTGWAARAEHPEVTTVCTVAGSANDLAPGPECSQGKLKR